MSGTINVAATEATQPRERITLDLADLDRAARSANYASEAVVTAHGMLVGGDYGDALEIIQIANESSQAAYLQLLDLGARPAPDGPAPAPVPLALHDTPAARRLLDALQYAVTCAQEVDAERGHVLVSGEGCGFVDAVGDLCERLRQQVEGAKGRE